ncbi:hypothetical protein FA95DRAFT_1576106 [Auriscalpium vulgare]|uniref:Uncharacterized protein n=1 Tax=Auriscalpium vulgare TaxID=40419 RepID=A0ACB8RD33_9AGAM|nr:hypothetical protein FA95DRAFT_1576106 [Auriscalpium vulgare]
MPSRHWTPEERQKFEADLCSLLIISNTAWWAVEHPFWRYFFKTWIPDSQVPGREALSGRVLDEQAKKVEDRMKLDVQGRYGTGQCDGWKNVTRASLIGSMVNVEYTPHLLNLYEVTSEKKTAVNLLVMVEKEIDYCINILGILLVAFCTDSGGDAASMRRLLFAKRPWIVVVACWAHQINLVVGDYFKNNPVFKKLVGDALEVVKWFNNHGRALGILKDVQKSFRGSILCLITPVLTRWTSHYLSVRRLLELEQCIWRAATDSEAELISAVGPERKAKAKATQMVAIMQDSSFWMGLRQIRQHLEPLAVAANITQSDNAHLDIVVSAIVNLYWIFSRPVVSPQVRASVIASLEKRWLNTDREVFVLAVLLNPYLRQTPFRIGSPFRNTHAPWVLFKRIFLRLFRVQPDPIAAEGAFTDYLKHVGQWSDKSMDLEGFRKAHEDQARSEYSAPSV